MARSCSHCLKFGAPTNDPLQGPQFIHDRPLGVRLKRARRPPVKRVPRRQRRTSSIESGIFRGDWWDYYNRAIRKYDSGDLSGAEADLRQALTFRPEEEARARTYGVRFQEYFPKAELGAILYETGRYTEAIGFLSDSMQTSPFEQSKFYLHEARRQVALQSGTDSGVPMIQLLEPLPETVTNRSTIRVRGTATDDIYIDSITVGAESLLIERAASTVQFEAEVPIPERINNVLVTVTDLVGRTASVTPVVVTDREGPVFSVSEVQIRDGGRKGYLKGSAYDPNSVREVTVDGRIVGGAGTASEGIDVEFPISQGQEEVDASPYG